ncbi:unnamed protein product [Paramecium pentaurelia]|uniref:Uncharacterized protein n=1 Tax=Paramecium pentaurelia TaxID=43138 RepID=A0A8S1Y1L9_9CILI|nr:unnamed protein product [Paramecium pentaurelia]
MKSNQEFEQEVEILIKESVSKNQSYIKDEGETKEKTLKKQFFNNRNKIDINEAWREIEKLFENFSIQDKKLIEKPIMKEEQKIIEQIDVLQTPQPKIHSHSIQTTKTKELLEEKEKDRNKRTVTRKLKFNLD